MIIDWLIDNLLIVLFISLIILFPLGLFFDYKKQEWLTQHCHVIGETDSTIAPAISYDGKISTVFIPGKTGYSCDDGKQYWR